MLASDTRVRRMRIRTAPGDTFALQRRVAEMTAGADLTGPFLSPAATLCIRRLDDPRPRTLSLSNRRPGPAREWEAAARARVSELALRAARPARGPVPATADAVLFMDRAELLACLARDWSDRVVASYWWWAALFSGKDEAGLVMRAWREAPEHVPAACHLLAAWRRLDDFVERLAPSDAVALTRAVARAFGIDGVDRALGRPSPRLPMQRLEAERTSIPWRQSPAALAWSELRDLLARHSDVPVAALPPERRALAIVALTLHRAPAMAPRLLSADVVEAILAPEILPASPVERNAPIQGPVVERPTHAHIGRRAISGRHGEAAPIESDRDDRVVEDAAPPRNARVSEAELAPAPVSKVEAPRPSNVAPFALPRPAEETVETGLGGVFYLINVAIDLELYGDFTKPRTPGLDLPIWDLLALVTLRLVGSDTFASDPIAPFLARLAGRERDLSDGYCASRDWLDALTLRIRERVAGALRIDGDAVPGVVIRRAARVTLSPSHLDVAFALDDLPIAIRLAGLDRDPGFVPAAGLTITFSYV
jgi:hypothetical protein